MSLFGILPPLRLLLDYATTPTLAGRVFRGQVTPLLRISSFSLCLVDDLPAQVTTRLGTWPSRNHCDFLCAVRIGFYGQTPRLAVEGELEPSLGKMVEDDHSVVGHRRPLIMEHS